MSETKSLEPSYCQERFKDEIVPTNKNLGTKWLVL